ncbi:Cj0814 family flagellar-dependent secreted protein, partial [Campylobacter canadensis]
DFNKAAGIPDNFKIHSDTLKNLVNDNENSYLAYKPFYEIDIAKSVGNAYKILSQVVGDDILNSKEFFNTEDIKQFPQGYIQARSDEIKINKILHSSDDYENNHGMTFQNELYQTHHPLFYSFDNDDRTKPNTNVFPPDNAKQDPRFSGYFGDYDVAKQKYINENGEISKGGLLIGILKSNPTLIEGESTYKGKLSGYDRKISSATFFAFDKALGMQVLARDENGFTSAEVENMPRWLKDYVRLNAYDKPISQRSTIVGSDNYTKTLYSPTSGFFSDNKKAEEKQLDEFMRKIRELIGMENPNKNISELNYDEFLKLAFSFSQNKMLNMKV